MSEYAKRAIIEAAADNEVLKQKLQDAATFEEAVSEVLSLDGTEKEAVKNTLGSEDSANPVQEAADERNNPGPGIIRPA